MFRVLGLPVRKVLQLLLALAYVRPNLSQVVSRVLLHRDELIAWELVDAEPFSEDFGREFGGVERKLSRLEVQRPRGGRPEFLRRRPEDPSIVVLGQRVAKECLPAHAEEDAIILSQTSEYPGGFEVEISAAQTGLLLFVGHGEAHRDTKQLPEPSTGSPHESAGHLRIVSECAAKPQVLRFVVSMATYTQQLRRRLEKIVELTDRLHEVSEIEYDPDRMARLARSGIVAMLPDSTWRHLDDEGRRRQREVVEQWNRWFEQVKLLFSGDAADTRRQLSEAAEKVSRWLHRSGRDFSVPKRIEDAGRVFREHVDPIFKLLAPFEVEGPTVAAPDTNVLLRNQELPTWGDTLGTHEFTVLLAPIRHSAEDLRT